MSGIMSMLLGAVSSAVDEFFNRVTLLLPGNGTNGAQNNTFLDSSSNNFTITRNGNTTQGTFSPFSQTGWSNFFDGTDDYLAVADNVVLRPGTSNFTLEAWIWRNASGAAHTIYAKGGASTGIVFQVTSTNVLRFTHTTTNIDSAGTIAANTWTHVAVVREGTGTNQTKLYINGSQDGQGSVSTDFTQTEEGRIGTNRGATEDFNGYISNLRFVKGTALYTGAFTPSTSPLTTTSQGATATEVELLTCQSNRFVDNSDNGFTITLTGTPSAQAFEPFPPTSAYSANDVGGSAYFDGNDYLTVAGGNSLAFGSGDFSLEAFVYPTASGSAMKIYDARPNTTAGNFPVFERNASNVAVFYVDTTALITGTTVIPANTWTHVLVSRVSGNLRLFVNGVQDGSTVSNSTNFANATARPAIAVRGSSLANDFLTGYISSVRVLIGSGFASVTVPTAPLTAITNTSLLANFTNAGITDATAKNVLETVGGAQISTTQSKFGGSSIAFDGSGDYLRFQNGPNLNFAFGTGDFTIELWIYMNAAANQTLFDIFDANSAGRILYQITSSRTVQLAGAGGANRTTTTGTVPLTTWSHVALCKASNVTRIFIDGVQANTNYTDTNTYTCTTGVVVFGINGSDLATNPLNAYIDDLRITRGIARYTANFTPPTAALPLQ
jgi:hypothetical protein